MRIDLHTHSSRSDGTDPPATLVAKAVASGIDVLGLTDHDTAAGWTEAEHAAREHGLGLLKGLELSTQHQGHSVHLLAYLPDPTAPDLAAALEQIVGSRGDRIPIMLARLTEAGYPVTRADLDAVTEPGAVPGRPHVADALVALGHVASRDQAFAELLGTGKPGYVGRWAPSLLDAVPMVVAAGGAAVVAHPKGHGYELADEVIAALAQRGLSGLEADHQDHDAQVRAELRGLAGELGLVVTGSSDFHGTGKVDHDLGCWTTEPEQLDRLLAAAENNALASGRRVPSYLPPG